jgi:hypothetical protein
MIVNILAPAYVVEVAEQLRVMRREASEPSS